MYIVDVNICVQVKRGGAVWKAEILESQRKILEVSSGTPEILSVYIVDSDV